ncbi:hypothetical protein ElyMa_001309700 [Elysia marginata]|uniref:Uncharacterized protein n=1 Tax=Elysia marginata TaxID=1093978 RepID=A0AAV4IHK6_9GAST|nr:hypothetical protein ElyMa_001309700 [Elysia marginata]
MLYLIQPKSYLKLKEKKFTPDPYRPVNPSTTRKLLLDSQTARMQHKPESHTRQQHQDVRTVYFNYIVHVHGGRLLYCSLVSQNDEEEEEAVKMLYFLY